ncbi:MAG: NERD domain-containing protein, partial [Oscillospiraceae bacterium]
MNEMFGNFFNWKLHTTFDYVSMGLLLLASFTLLYVYTRRAKRLRTDAAAARRVARRLHRCDRGAQIYEQLTMPTRGGEPILVEHLLLDDAGILLIQSFGRGLEIYGQAREETWKVVDPEQRVAIPNPVLRLEKAIDPLRSLLAERGIFQVPIAPLAVFADNFEPPKLYLGPTAEATSFQDLKPLLKKRAEAS